ncbi:secreted RxLR effector peptide protein, putative [Phytophthora infestans T30-4]|uniref:Secreted RxLR effector peptide protein, putative n=2 Tax=Phytophthora infestans TaxID=4787 RepID=D0MW73_PHYIT|nr:secreted RxLR effector peptide protein, putative [Phytophthora infestans T30-4]EEY63886.1 secreted RxLR effector peptide protein, putative [Phytophthora infestans T30-4]KAF4034156.1 hypothetical protein GN244_ATG13885 [Phytophthora infestans]KAF4137652.1 hypothetical protein GN958_ATG13164 [Phytophthora infestans]|eukprot:XP_002907322.1 secreted RxLR effector peptide protein, putative [Phytophthora infestans T30-4]
MRLTYILGMILAVSFRTSTAIPVTEEYNTIDNGVPPDVIYVVHEDGGRMLRRVEKPAFNGDVIEEERVFGGLTHFFKQLRSASKLKRNGVDALIFYRQVAANLKKAHK